MARRTIPRYGGPRNGYAKFLAIRAGIPKERAVPPYLRIDRGPRDGMLGPGTLRQVHAVSGGWWTTAVTVTVAGRLRGVPHVTQVEQQSRQVEVFQQTRPLLGLGTEEGQGRAICCYESGMSRSQQLEQGGVG